MLVISVLGYLFSCTRAWLMRLSCLALKGTAGGRQQSLREQGGSCHTGCWGGQPCTYCSFHCISLNCSVSEGAASTDVPQDGFCVSWGGDAGFKPVKPHRKALPEHLCICKFRCNIPFLLETSTMLHISLSLSETRCCSLVLVYSVKVHAFHLLLFCSLWWNQQQNGYMQ